MAFLLAFLFLFFWNYLVYTSLLILVQIRFLTHFLFSQLIYQLRLPGDCKFFTFKCSVNVTIKKKSGWKWQWGVNEIPSPFPWSPATRECSWKKNRIEKKKWPMKNIFLKLWVDKSLTHKHFVSLISLPKNKVHFWCDLKNRSYLEII